MLFCTIKDYKCMFLQEKKTVLRVISTHVEKCALFSALCAEDAINAKLATVLTSDV